MTESEKRDVPLATVRLSFTTPPFDPEILVALGAAKDVSSDGTWWCDFAATPDEESQYLMGSAHCHGPDFKNVYWEMDLLDFVGGGARSEGEESEDSPTTTVEHPSIAPPFVGPYPAAIDRLVDAIESLRSPIADVDVRLTFLVDSDRYRPQPVGVSERFSQRELLYMPAVSAPAGVSIKPFHFAWDIEGLDGVYRVGVQTSDIESSFWLVAFVNRTVRIVSTIRADLVEAVWAQVSRILEAKP